MVAFVHGFSSNVLALQFEWAWQNPTKSRFIKFALGHLHVTQRSFAVSVRLQVLAVLLANETFRDEHLAVHLLHGHSPVVSAAAPAAAPPSTIERPESSGSNSATTRRTAGEGSERLAEMFGREMARQSWDDGIPSITHGCPEAAGVLKRRKKRPRARRAGEGGGTTSTERSAAAAMARQHPVDRTMTTLDSSSDSEDDPLGASDQDGEEGMSESGSDDDGSDDDGSDMEEEAPSTGDDADIGRAFRCPGESDDDDDDGADGDSSRGHEVSPSAIQPTDSSPCIACPTGADNVHPRGKPQWWGSVSQRTSGPTSRAPPSRVSIVDLISSSDDGADENVVSGSSGHSDDEVILSLSQRLAVRAAREAMACAAVSEPAGSCASIACMPAVATDADDASDDDVVFVGIAREKSELPHARHDCRQYPINESAERHCDHCWCALCETPVVECCNWAEHCTTTSDVAAAVRASRREADIRLRLAGAPHPPPLDADSDGAQLVAQHPALRQTALAYLSHCAHDVEGTMTTLVACHEIEPDMAARVIAALEAVGDIIEIDGDLYVRPGRRPGVDVAA
jgi:hypothetical protein